MRTPLLVLSGKQIVFPVSSLLKLSPVENYSSLLVEGDTLVMELFLELNGIREIVSIRTMIWWDFLRAILF